MGFSFVLLLVVTLFCPVQTRIKTCKPTEFSCGDKRTTCVPMIWRCDGDKDCLNGVDEEGCGIKTCKPTEFSCGDESKRCLPMRWRCDGDKDCQNGADEEGCDGDAPVTSKNQTEQSEGIKTCEPSEFSCGDKRKTCVPMRWRCDGDKDCLNGVDEEGCVTKNEDAPVTSKNQTEQSEGIKSCEPTEFSCGDKRKTCVPMRWRCDGDKDCLNGADEEGCVTKNEDAPVTSKNQTVKSEDGDAPVTSKNQTEQSEGIKTCKPTEFSCGDKRKTCLPMRWRCDGDKDCLNGVDEEGCDAPVTSKNQTEQSEGIKSCEPTEFSCGDKRTTCVPMRWRCDGDKDCLNGADEEGCVTKNEDAPVTSKNQTEQSEDLASA
ncbi:very low-density lipoprotein receptor-like isoform X9 [Pseudorasbora parva]|uniref:very low-density lipoprotein receptor-like isoform X9 n=1 Tax=Pseudorasbora parva TaxID=51549 RepID=UPI00351E2214